MTKEAHKKFIASLLQGLEIQIEKLRHVKPGGLPQQALQGDIRARLNELQDLQVLSDEKRRAIEIIVRSIALVKSNDRPSQKFVYVDEPPYVFWLH